MLEKTLESPLDCKEIQPVNPKGNQAWIFTGRTNAEAPILLPPDASKNLLLGKDPDAGKDWRPEENETTEDEMVGWYHWWTWVWVNSRSWWWTGKPDMLQSMGSQRVGHDWMTELNWLPKLPIDLGEFSLLEVCKISWGAWACRESDLPYSSGKTAGIL